MKKMEVVSLLAACALLGLAPEARAQARDQACLSAPSEANCSGVFPDSCNVDAITLQPTAEDARIRVTVRYSPRCRSAWSRVINKTAATRTTQATIIRADGANFQVAPPVASGDAARSAMVFLGQGLCASSKGALLDDFGQVLSQLVTGCLYPPY
jgi:hypothetical protein